MAASTLSPIVNAAKMRSPNAADLPPCGGDVRQDRGGRRRAPTLIACRNLLQPPPPPPRPRRRPARRLRPPRRHRPDDPPGHALCRLAEFPRPAGQGLRGRRLHPHRSTPPRRWPRCRRQLASEGLTLVVFDCYRPGPGGRRLRAMDQAGRPAGPALASEGQARRPDRRRLYRRALQPFARLDGRPGARPRRPDAAASARPRLRRGKGRHARLRHRLRLLRRAQLHRAFAAADRPRSPTARSCVDGDAARPASATIRANGGTSR